jgi:uncharacterized protein YcbX
VSDQAVIRVSKLSVTAIKGFGVQHVERLHIAEDGVAGDRALFLVDDEDTLLSATRTSAFLPYWSRLTPQQDAEVLTIGLGQAELMSSALERGPVLRAHFFGDRYVGGYLVRGPWSELLSSVIGRSVRLVRAVDPMGGYDVHPITLMSEESVRALGREADGSPVDGRRFRMTVAVEGVPAFTEDTWQGGTLTLGRCVVRSGGPVKRCAAVQRAPEGRDGPINALRRIKDIRGVGMSEFGRGLNLGVYGEVVTAGQVQVGDPVHVSIAAS